MKKLLYPITGQFEGFGVQDTPLSFVENEFRFLRVSTKQLPFYFYIIIDKKFLPDNLEIRQPISLFIGDSFDNLMKTIEDKYNKNLKLVDALNTIKEFLNTKS